MQFNKKTLALFTVGILGIGGVASVGVQVFAQTSTPTASPVVTTQAADSKDAVGDAKDTKDENVALPVGGISETQARALISAKFPGVAIKRIELENNNGAVVYGAKLSDKTEVTVDAKTGVVLQEASDQEGVEHADGDYSGKDMNEAPGTETNDGPDTNGADKAD